MFTLKSVALLWYVCSEPKAAKLSLFNRNNALNACMKKEEKKEKEIHYEDSPDGGWGWMVVLHCFLVQLLLSSSLSFWRFSKCLSIGHVSSISFYIIVHMLYNDSGLGSIPFRFQSICKSKPNSNLEFQYTSWIDCNRKGIDPNPNPNPAFCSVADHVCVCVRLPTCVPLSVSDSRWMCWWWGP